MWLLLVALAASAGTPGTVDHPISGRVAVLDGDQIKRQVGDVGKQVDEQWNALTRKLLDLQDQVEGQLSTQVSRFEVVPGKHAAVKLPGGGSVDLDVTGREGEHVDVKVRVLDASGKPVAPPTAAWLSHGRSEERAALPVATTGEITIDDLSVSDDAMVQIYMGDGDVLVIWLDDELQR